MFKKIKKNKNYLKENILFLKIINKNIKYKHIALKKFKVIKYNIMYFINNNSNFFFENFNKKYFKNIIINKNLYLYKFIYKFKKFKFFDFFSIFFSRFKSNLIKLNYLKYNLILKLKKNVYSSVYIPLKINYLLNLENILINKEYINFLKLKKNNINNSNISQIFGGICLFSVL